MRRYTWVTATAVAAACAAVGCSETTAPVEPDRLEIAAGDDQEAVTGGHLAIGFGWLPDSLRVRLTDPNGAPLAGRTVSWTTTAGSLSPAASTTDEDGVASARWSFHSSSTGVVPAGTYQARASVAGADPVVFTGHARAGVTIQSISFNPDTVKIASEAATVSIAVKLTDDRRDAALEVVSALLYNPSANDADFQYASAHMALTSGNASDGEWTGSLVLPADAEHGAWTLRNITFSWGCGGGNRAVLIGEKLQLLGFTHQLPVVAAPAGSQAGSPARASSGFEHAGTVTATC